MGITLAGGAEFPHFDRLVILGQWIVILGFLLHLGVGIARLFRGAAPEILPAIAKAALGFATLALLPAIGEGAFRAGGELAEAIAGPARIDALKLAVGGALVSVIDDQGAFDMVSIEFWLSMATVLCTSFAYISKYIILEVLWPLYLGLVVVGGAISIPLGTIPGMKTAQAWVLTLLEAISWPVIFQVLLSVIAAVTVEHVDQVVNADGEFLPLLEGLATLCAVSLLTIMTPLIAARAMRGEGASAAMSFIAGKAAFMVSGLATRAAVGAVTAPAKLGMRALGAGPRLPGAHGGSPSPTPPMPSTPGGSGGPAATGSRPARRPIQRSPVRQGQPSDGASALARSQPGGSTRARLGEPQAAHAPSSARAASDPPRRSSTPGGATTQHAAAKPNTGAPRQGTSAAGRSTAKAPERNARVSARPSPSASSQGEPRAAGDAPEPRWAAARRAHRDSSPAHRTSTIAAEPTPQAISDASRLDGQTSDARQESGAPTGQPTSPRSAESPAPFDPPTKMTQPSSMTHEAPALTASQPVAAVRSDVRTTPGEQQRQTPPALNWRAANRQPVPTATAPEARRRFYNIRGSTKEATAALIAANKAGNLERAARIRTIVKAHPPVAGHAEKRARRDLIRRAIDRLDDTSTEAPKRPDPKPGDDS